MIQKTDMSTATTTLLENPEAFAWKDVDLAALDRELARLTEAEEKKLEAAQREIEELFVGKDDSVGRGGEKIMADTSLDSSLTAISELAEEGENRRDFESMETGRSNLTILLETVDSGPLVSLPVFGESLLKCEKVAEVGEVIGDPADDLDEEVLNEDLEKLLAEQGRRASLIQDLKKSDAQKSKEMATLASPKISPLSKVQRR